MDTRPVAFRLQAHPNPATNAGLKLAWSVDRNDLYDVIVYNILGQMVQEISRERMSVGEYSEHIGDNLAAGVYFAVISRADARRVVKFVILR
ncbi:MAG: T9SS type A sorting domain-containing protein [Candidatus Zixiibacteriota bacterium]|nr:MAG: T9SS type A sorting domain-containing protein [candidate division Zixibacteria bacterium]